MAELPVKSVTESSNREERPRYEPPRIQVLTEREILNTFQITQAMQTWWIAGC
ncbi:MAG TPA: hypothetical protein VLU06_10380 [Thermoanaerobaculia bacterium]|nr:hypothetical protein [Thermoanaerobaculia bacterium]